MKIICRSTHLTELYILDNVTGKIRNFTYEGKMCTECACGDNIKLNKTAETIQSQMNY